MYINLTKKEITFIYEYLLTMNNNESIISNQQKELLSQLFNKFEATMKENID